jgi:hypothetical protein
MIFFKTRLERAIYHYMTVFTYISNIMLVFILLKFLDSIIENPNVDSNFQMLESKKISTLKKDMIFEIRMKNNHKIINDML